MIKTLLTFLFLYLVFRLTHRFLTRNFARGFFSHGSNGSGSQETIEDEIKPCPTCGTYNPKRSAIKDGEYYFCNLECRDKYKK